MTSLRTSLVMAPMLAATLGLAGPSGARAQTTPAAASISAAETVKAYKMDAARHVYAVYANRIYKGKLPPLVHAIVVLEVDLDESGNLRHITPVRVPSHAPDVAVAVTHMLELAAPLPAPRRMGGVRFTEVWLVDKSGRFQLDTLTEGQR